MLTYIYLVLGLLVLVFVIKIWIRKIKRGTVFTKPHLSNNQKRNASFSVSGNLVREFKTSITNTYEVTRTLLGRGSSAEVVIGQNLVSKRRYAIKIIDISRKPDIVWRYHREMNFLKDIEHTNTIRLYEVYSTPSAMFFVMELCTGGHLGHLIKKQPDGFLSESKARKYTLQILGAIRYCHSKGICHRDIKLQNILLENKEVDAQVKIVDFGNAARLKPGTLLTKVVGTTYTAAPEVFRQAYDERCDIWSLGVVVYILLCGRRPFERLEIAQSIRQQESSVIASILMGRYHFRHEAFEIISDDAIDFIKLCLELDFRHRSTAVKLLAHRWFLNSCDESRRISDPNARGLSYIGAETLRGISNRYLSPSGGQVKNGNMRQASMLAVAFTRAPTVKVKQLRKLFQEIDRNGNGLIELEEFRSAMNLVDPALSPADIELLFSLIDQDQSKNISYLEFLAAMIDPREVDVQEMNQAFRLLDKDQKGFLTRDDLLRLLSTVSAEEASRLADSTEGQNNSPQSLLNAGNSKTMSIESEEGAAMVKSQVAEALRLKRLQERIECIMDRVDVNRDGVISFTEFLFAMAEDSSIFSSPRNANQETFVPSRSPGAQRSFRNDGNRALFTRQRSEGAVRLGGAGFSQLEPGSARSANALNRKSKRKLSSFLVDTWRLFFSRTKIAVEDRVEFRGKGLEPIDSIEDSDWSLCERGQARANEHVRGQSQSTAGTGTAGTGTAGTGTAGTGTAGTGTAGRDDPLALVHTVDNDRVQAFEENDSSDEGELPKSLYKMASLSHTRTGQLHKALPRAPMLCKGAKAFTSPALLNTCEATAIVKDFIGQKIVKSKEGEDVGEDFIVADLE